MRTGFIASCFVVGTLLIPVASNAADSTSAQPMTFVTDSMITSKIKAKLAAEKLSSLAQIKVDTDSKGAVVLSGNVKTQQEADRALAIARSTEGVTSVTSNIQIRKEN